DSLLFSEPISPGTVRTLACERERVVAHWLELHGDVESVRHVDLVLLQGAVGVGEGAGDGLAGAVRTEHLGTLEIKCGRELNSGRVREICGQSTVLDTVLAIVDESDVEAEPGTDQREKENQAAHL
ncbi:hypothetical protein PENTCL1PPCAC_20317, partial [Pristionchus entomophagus]